MPPKSPRRLTKLGPRLSAGQPRLSSPPKITEDFYRTPAWISLVRRLTAVRGRRCQACGKTRDDDDKPVRLIADHIVERRDGGAELDPANIQLLCIRLNADGQGGCHNRKTTEARHRRTQERT